MKTIILTPHLLNGGSMKNAIRRTVAQMLIAVAVILPAAEVRQQTAAQPFSTLERVAVAIQQASADGRYFVVVNFRDKSWKEENQVRDMLRAQGYTVKYTRDNNVYGWNKLNAALKINW